MTNDQPALREVKLRTAPVLHIGLLGLALFSVDFLLSLMLFMVYAGFKRIHIGSFQHINTLLGLYHSGSLPGLFLWVPLKGFITGVLVGGLLRIASGWGWLRFQVEVPSTPESPQT